MCSQLGQQICYKKNLYIRENNELNFYELWDEEPPRMSHMTAQCCPILTEMLFALLWYLPFTL